MSIDWSHKHLIVLSGPTAVGKTALSLQLAGYFNTPIISADSRQIYRRMNIGTAKPEQAILDAVPHYFINHLDISTPYSAGAFEREALALVHRLFSASNVLLLAGGTGLYIDALCKGLDALPDVPVAIKTAVLQEYDQKGLEPFLEELMISDPDYYHRVDRYNPRRILRAIEVIRTSGKPLSSFRKNSPKSRLFQTHYILLQREKIALYERINQRVDDMIQQGLIEEARSLLPLRSYRALDTVGYRELFEYFDGKYTLTEAIEKIKTNTRRYAKRQGTWFRRSDKWTSFPADNEAAILDYLKATIEG